MVQEPEHYNNDVERQRLQIKISHRVGGGGQSSNGLECWQDIDKRLDTNAFYPLKKCML
jgi:hypothetical protein